jgi:predicted nuclease with TOPRIM domain
MRAIALIIPAVLVAGLAGSARGEEVDRYRLEKTENGYIRMDTRTGEVSTCEETTGKLVCTIAPDERLALQDEIERLQAKLDALDQRVAKLEAQPSIPKVLVPSDEEVDKSLDIMEKFFHRFMGIMKEMDKQDAQPQRT